MKTQNVKAKLTFNKSAVLELNDTHLLNVKGGTTITVSPASFSITVSIIVYTAGTFGIKIQK